MKTVKLSIMGTNAAGINCKKESLLKTIKHFNPSIITIQESKNTKPGTIKMPGYQVFEKIRNEKGGGGLLTAAGC